MNAIKANNIPKLSVNKIVDKLSKAYCSLIMSGQPLRLMPSVMLWGPPGIGKSQGVRQLAKNIEYTTGKKTVVTDVRLLLFNPVDLRGIPTSNADKTLAVWLKPKIFQMDESDSVINILFLDEISAAPQSVQAAVYQITLDRTVGEHRLPENCIVIAAGNRITDKSVAFKMPKALANRLCHIEIDADFESWKQWAVESGVNPKVIGFITARKDFLFAFDTKSEELAFATPRSWEMVSNILNHTNDNVEEVYQLIAGCIGVGAAVEFLSWGRVYNQLPAVEDIFNNRPAPVPQTTDAVYALISVMADYARRHKDELNKIENSINYAEKLPPDFSVILMRDYMYIEKGYKQRLMGIPAFARWLTTKGRYMNNDY